MGSGLVVEQYTTDELADAINAAMIDLLNAPWRKGPIFILTQQDFPALIDKTFEKLYRDAPLPSKGVNTKLMAQMVASKLCIIRP